MKDDILLGPFEFSMTFQDLENMVFHAVCINSTKGRLTVDRSGKCFIFMNNLYVKKGHSVLLFTFNYK